MKSSTMVLQVMISFLLISGGSSGRLVMKNGLFIAPDNPSALDPNFNSLADDDSTLHTAYGHLEKDVVECDQDISPWRISSAKSATNKKKESFKLSPSVQKTTKPHSPASVDQSDGVFNFLPKGAVTPSGPSPKVNSMVTEERLSTSSNSPEVGHMQMIRPNPKTLNRHTLKSHGSHGDDDVQQEINKRMLGSSSSPGGGH